MTFTPTEDAFEITADFDLANADSRDTQPSYNEVVASTTWLDGRANWGIAGTNWNTGPVYELPDSEPLLLASADVTGAIGEHLDRLWRQVHDRHGGQVLLSRAVSLAAGCAGTDEADDDGVEMEEEDEVEKSIVRWAAVPLADWPAVRRLVDFLERIYEPTVQFGEKVE